jgi:peptidoglycan/LPS O-acetylase OafA/YrhL
VVGLGIISYSVYLIHGLVIFAAGGWLRAQYPPTALLLGWMVPVLAATVAACWLFYRVAEKPFLELRARRLRAAPSKTAAEAAP